MSPKKPKENENLEAKEAEAGKEEAAAKKKAAAKPAGEKKAPAKKAAPKAKKAEGEAPAAEKPAPKPKKAKAEAPAPEPELPKKPDLKRFMFSHSTVEGTIAAGPTGQKEEPKPVEPPKPAAGKEKLNLVGAQPGQTPPDRTNMTTGSSAGSPGQFSGAKVFEFDKPKPQLMPKTVGPPVNRSGRAAVMEGSN
jgi:hypothetical protein